MRTPSLLFRQAVYQPHTSEVPVLLMTIDHPSLTAPIRLSTDNADSFTVNSVTVRGTISNGEQYLFLPMEITLPDDSDESISQAKITLDNIDRDILAAVRTMATYPTVSLVVVLASTPDTVEARFDNFQLSDVKADALVVSGTLSLGNFLAEPFPGGTILPSNFPGLF